MALASRRFSGFVVTDSAKRSSVERMVDRWLTKASRRALVRCLEREIAFSVLILLSPRFWKDVPLHIYTVSVWVITMESIPKNNMCVCKH